MGFFIRAKLYFRQLIGQEPRTNVEIACECRHIHEWCICPVGIDSASSVFSLGVGNDIGFDTGLIKDFNCSVYAFDPTPRWVEWIGSMSLPEKFKFYPYAIGGTDGTMKLFPRIHKGRRSSKMLTLLNEGLHDDESIAVTMKRLSTLTAELSVPSIAILKIDIEAAEYEVIDDFLADHVPVYQLLVEFHHRFASVPVKKTTDALAKLYKAGYRIFYVSEKAREYSFIHEATYDGYRRQAGKSS
ncbi:FkbM family methyltransferase [Chlorobium phaeobacteroides]|uniref:Methyltransferase FkbM family n=1 Tax=Chlorobium phaeobacteroides (strain DSM 266 / SMG 266 / 2430) TaxID=290317 RepID=A1BDG4_CHLPD|nr:FkbM family methyltransferase [Chlorobium phaeobacteroides]ABL64441.1 methyltransferase FkbM family [Chlorobium phaeobacteroides DSM 266]MBV5319792.1 FkbM family methyltransferase [Chlorobium phaeobacteroides]